MIEVPEIASRFRQWADDAASMAGRAVVPEDWKIFVDLGARFDTGKPCKSLDACMEAIQIVMAKELERGLAKQAEKAIDNIADAWLYYFGPRSL